MRRCSGDLPGVKIVNERCGNKQLPGLKLVLYSQRLFLKAAMALAAVPLLNTGAVRGQIEAERPLVAYVGTFSSPLHDVLPTQVDLPPGNGRGIHIFHVDRSTGALTPSGIHELGTSPSCLVVNASERACIRPTRPIALAKTRKER
jgi:hypothetical protein